MEILLVTIILYYRNYSNLQGFSGGRILLNNAENYGVYLAEALVSPTVGTSQFPNGITFFETNIGN